jgi:hypothetical protein
LRTGVGCGASWRNFNLDACAGQNGLGSFDIVQPVLKPAARDGIVEEGSFAHERGSRPGGRQYARHSTILLDTFEHIRGVLMGDEFRGEGFSKPQHPQDPVSGRGGRQMLESVAADDMAKGENPPIEKFEDFRQNIESG